MIPENSTKFGIGEKIGAGLTVKARFSRDGFCRFLRETHMSATAQHVAAATGIAASTVDKWLREAANPSADHLALLLAAYGAPLMAAAFPVSQDWLAGQVRHEKIQAALEQLQAAMEGVADP